MEDKDLVALLQGFAGRIIDELKNQPEQPRQEWYSPAEIATIFGVKKRYVLGAIRRHELPAANVAQGEQPKYNVNLRDADAWMRDKMLRGVGDTKQERGELVTKFFGGKRRAAG